MSRRKPIPDRVAAVLIAGSALLGLGFSYLILVCVLVVSCDAEPSREEFARVPSPDGCLEAVIVVVNYHATVAFCFEVHVVETGGERGDDPATFTYRRRPEVRWNGDELLVDDTGAEISRLMRDTVAVGGRDVVVELASGRR